MDKRCRYQKWILSVVLLLAISPSFAVEVSIEQAKAAVGNWLRRGRALDGRLGRAVMSARTCFATNGAPFHVVKLDQGFVITSGDTKLAPVIIHAAGADVIEDESNPLWVLIRKDIALRAAAAGVVPSSGQRKKNLLAVAPAAATPSVEECEWAELLGEDSVSANSVSGIVRKVNLASEGLVQVADVRVAPLLKSQWNQEHVAGRALYNYYTPSQWPCGCVATAGAQIMRYFRWPEGSVPMNTYPCRYQTSITDLGYGRYRVNYANANYTLRGGTYDWNNMPLVPGNGVTDAQREAIGKLTSDVGIACGMDYSELGSGAGGYMLARALTVDFGYSNAIAYQLNGVNADADQIKKALVSNFDAGLPVAVSIDGAGGHEIVGDGYGYSGGTLYYHFNMGWGGNDDAWYAPPHMGTSNGAFNVLDGFVYNIYTDMQKDAVIASGRVVTSGGVPIVGATVTAKKNGVTVATKTTDARGIYALVLPAGTYSITASKSGSMNSRSVALSACVPLKLSDNFGSYLLSPTPSVGNECEQDIVLNGVASVAEPLISPVPSGGLFYPSVKVSITCSTPGVVIRYTLDGREPTELSAAYGGPIFIDDTTTVRARAFKSGLNPSGVSSMTYVYDASQGGPKGDRFANPMRISGASGSRMVEDMSQYTIEAGEPTHSLSGGYYSQEFGSAWFAWTAPGSGAMTFTVRCNGDSYRYPVLVAVYEGESLSLVKRLAMAKNYADNDYSSIVSLSVEQGKVYRIVGVTLYDLGGDAAEFVLSWSGDLEVETVDPFPTIGNLAETFGANSDVARYITTATKLADFNAFLRDCNVASAGEITSAQKPFVYQSFVLGSVLQTPVLLTREPELKVDSFVPNASNAARWDVKVSLDAGQSVQMVAQKLAEAIRVGTDAKSITSPATVTAQSGEIGNPLTFTIAKPGEKSGFVKLLIAR